MDRASQVLAQGVPPGVPKSYRALADHHGNVSHSTLHRTRGQPPIEEKARGQQYLKPYEEEVIIKYLLQMSELGYPIRMKFIPSLAFTSLRSLVCAHRAFFKYFQASRKRLQALKPRSHDFHLKSLQPLLIVIIYNLWKGYKNN
jgi:hypothetical protein